MGVWSRGATSTNCSNTSGMFHSDGLAFQQNKRRMMYYTFMFFLWLFLLFLKVAVDPAGAEYPTVISLLRSGIFMYSYSQIVTVTIHCIWFTRSERKKKVPDIIHRFAFT